MVPTPALPAIGRWVDREDPKAKVNEALWKVTPDVVMFAEADRNLGTTYLLDDNLVERIMAAPGGRQPRRRCAAAAAPSRG